MILHRTFRNSILITTFLVVIGNIGISLLPNSYVTKPVTAREIPKPEETLMPASVITADVAPTTTEPVQEATPIVSTTSTTATPAISPKTKSLPPPVVQTNPEKLIVTKLVEKVMETNVADQDDYLTKIADLIKEQTNAFRRSHKLSALKSDSVLSGNATKYSNTMLAGKFLSHTDQNDCNMSCRFVRDNYQAWAWGENLAVLHFSEQPSPEYVASYFMREWKKSVGHRENILSSRYTTEGTGIAMSKNIIYVTVQFAQPKI